MAVLVVSCIIIVGVCRFNHDRCQGNAQDERTEEDDSAALFIILWMSVMEDNDWRMMKDDRNDFCRHDGKCPESV